LTQRGIEQILELDLNEQEQRQFSESALSIKKNIQRLAIFHH